jgi:SAM-dependent methyltransferase
MSPPSRPSAPLSDRLDSALLALAAGRRRPLLELARDVPGVAAEMARQFSMTPAAVAYDLSMLHAAEHEERTEALTARYDPLLLGRADVRPGDAVLDVGCGAGGFTVELGRLAAPGPVVGIDVAPPLVARARRRLPAAGPANVTFVEGDAGSHDLQAGSFDVAVSRFAAMYLDHPVAAFANLAGALRPGGRLALLVWRDLDANEWMAAVGEALAGGRSAPERPAGDPGAFALADEATVRAVLGEAGFDDLAVDAADEPVVFGADADEAFDFVSTLDLARRMLEGFDGPSRRAALGRLRDVLAAHATDEGVLFGSGAWLVSARRP